MDDFTCFAIFFLFSTVYKEDVGYQGAYIAFDRTLH